MNDLFQSLIKERFFPDTNNEEKGDDVDVDDNY